MRHVGPEGDSMLKAVAGFVLVSGLATAGVAQDHANCPMAGSDAHRAKVDHRHGEATGVAHEGTVHHFLLTKDGGSIGLEVNDAGRTEDRDHIREHLQVVARSFAAGDFALSLSVRL